MDEGSQRRHDSPGNHDPADPLSGAPALDDQGSGDFEDQVADEEHAHAEAEGRLGEAQRFQVGLHSELGEADVDAVDIGDHVAHEQDRQEPEVGFRSGTVEALVPGEGAMGKLAVGWEEKVSLASRSRR